MAEFNLVKVPGGVEVKVPALDKLLDYVASGVGAVAGPLLAPWRASREGQARVITAEMDAKVRQIQAAEENSTSQLIAKAQAEARESVVPDKLESDRSLRIGLNEVQNAMEFQAKKRLMNIGAIAGHAAEELGDREVPDHNPDPDWAARFFNCAQDISSEELQKLWGRILAGEIKSPGQTSLRTLSILRDMTQQDAKNFSDLMHFRISNFIFHEEPNLEKMLGESFNWLAHFSRIGLLGGFGEPKGITLGENGQWMGDHCGHTLIIEGEPGQTFKMRTFSSPYMASLITAEGMKLAKLCQHHEPHLQYLSHVARLLRKQHCTLKIAKIIDQNAEYFQFFHSDIRIIEPFVEPEEHDQQEPSNDQ